MKTIEEIKYQIGNLMNAIFWYNIKLPQETKDFLKEVLSWQTVSDVDPVIFFEFENLAFDILNMLEGKEDTVVYKYINN